jgi:hypothetical protein
MLLRATVLAVGFGVASCVGLEAGNYQWRMDLYALFDNPDGAFDMADLSSFMLRDLSSIVSDVHQRFDEGDFDELWIKRLPVIMEPPIVVPRMPLKRACDGSGVIEKSAVGVYELTSNDTFGNRNWQSTPYPGFGSLFMPVGVCSNSDVVTLDVADFVCPPGVPGPTGERGCLVVVDLTVPSVDIATVMGITQEPCSTHLSFKLRNCTSIKDFRENCAMNSYRMEFAGVNPAPALSCNLYSLTPSCRTGCGETTCLRTPSDQVEWTFKHRELGLPFWQKRCDPSANRIRVEAFAEAAGVQGAAREHRVVPWSVQSETCAHVDGCGSTDSKIGGFYCTRIYSPLCTRCIIPGTVASPFSSEKRVSTWPVCPYDILDTYTTGVEPECASTAAKDGCCLYSNTCDGDASPSEAALDSSGLALVASRKNDADMAVYLLRLCTTIPDESKVPAFAHNLWNMYPLGLDFEIVKQDFQKQVCEFKLERARVKLVLRLVVASCGLFGAVMGLILCAVNRVREVPGRPRGESELVGLSHA